ncbi:exodeoxyribonuclease VII small subunit [Thermincola ferriacetica]|uniref:Exodeoxyribonuclease 7 small subunit n=2 Tax=Thermincola TaxID=278993 RepID=D5X7I1_THEPJ|nr:MULTISPECIES: exodeoxyribonuclease VII small subunit [Thermincola]ADG82551.1 exodeoxyribonuclease VII, small subunit [Thermincola potens JR]KNZ70733.1 exodeoxyribonuclease VII small subunit [Thermincola ferriacetica]
MSGEQEFNLDIENFEEAINRLEEIVKTLEEGNIGLDEALQKFETGVRLSRYCNNKLTEAERKINMLIRENDGTFSVKPVNPTEDFNE